MDRPANRVLTADARSSSNFFNSDRILQHYLKKHLLKDGLDYMNDKLVRLGKQAATEMNPLSQKADRESPVLKRRNKLGEWVNEVEFHPAYWQLVDIAAQSEMFYVKYQSE